MFQVTIVCLTVFLIYAMEFLQNAFYCPFLILLSGNRFKNSKWNQSSPKTFSCQDYHKITQPSRGQGEEFHCSHIWWDKWEVTALIYAFLLPFFKGEREWHCKNLKSRIMRDNWGVVHVPQVGQHVICKLNETLRGSKAAPHYSLETFTLCPFPNLGHF